MATPDPYVGLAIHALLSVALGGGLILAGVIVRHRVVRSRGAKHETYECGERPFGPAWRKTPAGFYLLALLFVLFDAEAAFLFVWILGLRQLGPAAFWAMVVFLAVLLVGWIYAWRRGDLEWAR